MGRERQILACSGVLYPPGGFPPERMGAQLWQAMRLAGVRGPRVCIIATAVGDAREYIDRWYARAASFGEAEVSHLELFVRPNVADVRAHLLAQDVIFVTGGSVVNLLAVWRAHRLDEILRECWEAGVVLAGQSAGSLCWHSGGVTDSFGDALDAIDDGLGLLPFSNGVHDDLGDQPRRERYRYFVAQGGLPAGHATEDGVALHYVGTRLHEALGVLPDRNAWLVEPDGPGRYREKAIPARYWVP
ncbi:peptidase E [Sphaerisporangium melleum]|uniref:Peptidase E n=1 Tax=Sphaerisporangium melleum TaxID=321316 RepID=A0A917VKT3_9ACTN|nr:peptidase E [Sphaerisporangium melleum]GGK91563.1 peptidase E [Sphaerisporangium melleum]GII72916.1 peptidase E [Sphaerisporangium melleum]